MHRTYLAAAALLFLVPAPASAQDAANGEQVFKRCRACHQIGDTAKNTVGPVLNNIVGRPAGAVDGFNYSSANKEAGQKGLTWTEDNLFKYLEAPAAFMPKNKMAFAGLRDPADRRDLIAYLKTFSK